MAVKRWTNTRQQFLDTNGDPYSGGKLYWYVAGSTTPQDTFNASDGLSANANPVVLGSDGRPSSEIWLTTGVSYKLVFKTSADATVFTEDNISPVNDTTVTVSEWIDGPTPTYISASSFSLVGDQTSTFTVGRRVKIVDAGGTKYGTIATSAYTSLTTITLDANSDSLASPTSSLSYGIINPTNTSMPLLDEDDMVSNSASLPASQQSVKAYAVPLAGGTMTGALTVNGQIAFPATQNASANANTLDDYEEGTWTPGLTFGGSFTGGSLTSGDGFYTKIGRHVWVTGYILVGAVGSSTGSAAITGLPFTPSMTNLAATTLAGGVCNWTSMATSLITVSCFAAHSTTSLSIKGLTAGATSLANLTHADFAASSRLNFTCVYPAAT